MFFVAAFVAFVFFTAALENSASRWKDSCRKGGQECSQVKADQEGGQDGGQEGGQEGGHEGDQEGGQEGVQEGGQGHGKGYALLKAVAERAIPPAPGEEMHALYTEFAMFWQIFSGM